LAKAFRGELVPTEAELARREGRTYEPASALLERIKAERATASQNGTRIKAKKTKK
jgi:type I restriction enzyme S subunit